MDYKEKIYQNYISSHTKNLFLPKSIKEIENRFYIFNGYYRKYLPQDKNAAIIDIGCGIGELVFWLKRNGYKNTEGIDISKENVEFAKKIGIDIACADFFQYLQDKSNYYDVVFAIDILEHFKKDEVLKALNLIFKSLKKGGILIIKTPNAESILGSRYLYSDFTHELAFTKRSLQEILILTGFNKIEFQETKPIPHGLVSFFRLILWKVVRNFIKVYILIETGERSDILTQNIIAVAFKDSSEE